MSSRSGRCCGSDPVAGPDSGSIFGSGGPGPVIGPGSNSVSSSSCSESVMEPSSDSVSSVIGLGSDFDFSWALAPWVSGSGGPGPVVGPSFDSIPHIVPEGNLGT